MLKLKFTPENKNSVEAAKSYAKIWQKEGNRIVTAIENSTNLEFKDKFIEVTVFEGISQSHPMKLRASYDDETKTATLVHELLHRISADYMLKKPDPIDDLSLGLHKQIDLVLYDLWTGLFGEDVANRQVENESSRTALYKQAWEWALSLSKKQRAEIFAKLNVQ